MVISLPPADLTLSANYASGCPPPAGGDLLIAIAAFLNRAR